MALFVLWVIHHLLVVGPIFCCCCCLLHSKSLTPSICFFANIVTVFVKGNKLAQVLA